MTLLSNLAIRNAKPELKAYTLKDGHGLFLRVEPNGTKVWHFRFYWQDKQKLISFGTYPKVDIKTAREKREEARALLAQNKDPRQKKKQQAIYGSNNTGIKRMGYHGRLTGHGIRATLSTALNELGYRKEWIEAQLSHSDKDQIRAAYNHAEYVEQRREMMQDWADKLDEWER